MIPNEVVKFVNKGSSKDVGRLLMMIGDRLSSWELTPLEEVEKERIPEGLKIREKDEDYDW